MIDALIHDCACEDTHMEFKSIKAFEDRNTFKTELPKDVSSFANSGGGVIIIGIEEDKTGHAVSVCGTQDPKIAAQWFEDVLLSSVRPKLPGLLIHEISHTTGRVFVIEIPLSHSAPHQASDKRFYARRQRRRDPLEVHEIDLLRLRGISIDDAVFGGLIIENGILCAHVENQRKHPIFNAKLNVPDKQSMALEHQRDLLVRGISVLPARSTTKAFLGSIINLINKPEFAESFEYSFEYCLEPGTHFRCLTGRLALGELRGTLRQESEPEKTRGVIQKGFEELKQSIDSMSSNLTMGINNLTDPTGLAISFSTLEKLRSVVTHDGVIGKWRGEWLSREGFMELLGVDRKTALKLYRLFDACRYDDPSLREPLAAHPWVTPELASRLTERVEMPDWMLSE